MNPSSDNQLPGIILRRSSNEDHHVTEDVHLDTIVLTNGRFSDETESEENNVRLAVKWPWRVASFTFETLAVLMVLTSSTVQSICRNRDIAFTADCILGGNCPTQHENSTIDFCLQQNHHQE